MGPRELDQVSVGVIELDADAVVLQYNATESRITGLSPVDVVGRNFFAEIAPCTAVPEFEGRFRRGVRSGSLEAEFEFEFNFVLAPVRVSVRMTLDDESGRYWLMTQTMNDHGERPDRWGASAWTRGLDSSVDLGDIDEDECEAEAIHLPGSIQSFGSLVVLSWPDLQAVAVDEAIHGVLGLPPDEVLGRGADELFPREVAALVRRVGQAGDLIVRDRLRLERDELPLDVVVHRWAGRVLVELVPGEPAYDVLTKLQIAVDDLQDATEEHVWQRACERVADLTGFDRVLGYQMGPHGDGTVMAEALRGELPSLAGLSFPASDIPGQARKLYVHHRLRYCPNVTATQVRVRAAEGEGDVDLSFCSLRSPSPFHLAYQRNLGVYGALSISVVVGGRLRGLIICHHPRPRTIALEYRVACEMLGRFLERAIQSAEQRRVDEQRVRMGAAYTEVVRGLSAWDGSGKPPRELLTAIATAFDADGAALGLGDRSWCSSPARAGWAHALLHSSEASSEPSFTVRSGPEDGAGVPPGRLLVAPATQLAVRVLAFREKLSTPKLWGRGAEALPGAISRWEESRGDVARPWSDLERQVAAQLHRDLRRSLGPLLETRLLLRRIVEGSPDGVVLCDAEGKMVDLNRSARRLLALGDETLAEPPLASFIDRWQPRVSLHPELFVDSPASTVPIPVRVVTVAHDAGRVHYVVFIQDLRPLRALERQLAESKRIEEAATLATGLAHDFNNTLSVILGQAELLLDDAPSGSEARDMLGDIVAATTDGRRIAHDMLAFASASRNVDEPRAWVGRTVRSSQRMLKALLGDALMLTVDAEPGDDRLVALSQGELQQVLFNLISNAGHFARAQVRLTVSHPGRSVRIEVRDDGPGMPEEVLDRVFEPFFTTRGRRAGTGLGLYVVAGLVKNAGGEVRARVEDGSVFTVDLPTVERGGELSVVSHPPSPATSRISARVLVVDDNDLVRKTVERALRKHGFEVEGAEDGRAALERIHQRRPDVVVSDLEMPRMTGRELAEEIAPTGLPVVLTTGHVHISGIEDLPDNVKVLNKPYPTGALIDAIRTLINRAGRSSSPP